MSEFVIFLSETFAEFGEISSRKMFGGYGIYHQGLMFGLVADDELFLKVDSINQAEFESQGCEAFSYNKNGTEMKMSYFRAPEEIYEDSDKAVHWARLAYDAALRKKK